MSKKSRKRNKRILAVLGVGAAAAMAAKKRKAASASDVESNDNAFREKTKSTPTGPAELGLTTRKDTAVKTDKTIQDNKPKDTAPKKVRMTSANVQSGKIDAPLKGIFNFGDGVAKRRAEEASFNAKLRKNNNPNVTGTTKPGMKSGGRAGYKSGGSSVKKSMGKALRGGGKVMR